MIIIPEKLNRPAILAFFLGLTIRAYTALNTHLINLDGMYYINQAKNLYLGQYKEIIHTLGFLPLNSILIVPAYAIFNDWLIAARFVSLFFSIALLVPMYLTIRKFFNEEYSVAVLLVFALIPTLVSRSPDVIKDPTSWFFLTLALYFFTCLTEEKHLKTFSFLSSISFCLAIWARNEIVLCYAITFFCIFFVVHSNRQKLITAFVFVSPLIIVVVVEAWLQNHDIKISRLTLETILSPRPIGSTYSTIHSQLLELAGQHQFSTIGYFFPEAANLLWLIALGALTTTAAEAVSHLYLFLFAIGFLSMNSFSQKDKRVWYFFALAAATTLVLYNEMLSNWIVEYRYFGVVIIPAAIFAGHGINKICTYNQTHFKTPENKTLSVIIALILIFGVTKNCQPRYLDKLVFKEIGQTIAQKEKNTGPIHIAGASYMAIRWVSFYANENNPDEIIYPSQIKKLSHTQLANCAKLAKNLSKANINYIVTEEKYLKDIKTAISADLTDFFEQQGVWHHKDTGKITLYKLKSPKIKNG